MKAKLEKNKNNQQALLRASIMHGFFFLEANINYIAEHFEESDMFNVSEKSVLLEKEMILNIGNFELSNRLKISRITDKIEMILKKCSDNYTSSTEKWYPTLKEAIDVRNKLTHPKEAHELHCGATERYLKSILECVNSISVSVFKKKVPYINKTMDSGLIF